jgi:hypothetical protein
MQTLADTMPTSRSITRVGGWSLILAAFGFIGVFSYLAARFNYPVVLDGVASDVLPQLLSLGATGRGVWVFYALLPLLLIPAGLAYSAAMKAVAPNLSRVILVGAVLSAISMLLGLARWPTIQWELARAYGGASADARHAIDAIFLGLNVYLGNFVGELIGELALNVFFVAIGLAGLRSLQIGNWFGYSSVAVGVIGFIAALRNMTGIVQPIAEVNNYVLPVWLIVLGVVLVRWRVVVPAAPVCAMTGRHANFAKVA